VATLGMANIRVIVLVVWHVLLEDGVENVALICAGDPCCPRAPSMRLRRVVDHPTPPYGRAFGSGNRALCSYVCAPSSSSRLAPV
jgi:hypothetical protein